MYSEYIQTCMHLLVQFHSGIPKFLTGWYCDDPKWENHPSTHEVPGAVQSNFAIGSGMGGGGKTPSRKERSSCGSSLAEVPGSSMLKMEPKSWFTFSHVTWSASLFFSSSSLITCRGRRKWGGGAHEQGSGLGVLGQKGLPDGQCDGTQGR